MRYSAIMKTATLPSIRIEPELRDELEASLKEGETLTEFIEESVRSRLRRRTEQAAFIARGLASLEDAKTTGIYHPADVVIRELKQMLDDRVEEERRRRAGLAKG
jgi:hypothetical protein